MPRKGTVQIREIAPDTVYQEVLIQLLINRMLMGGRKATSRKVVYGAIDIIKEKTKQDPIEVIKKAVKNVRPVLEVKPRRVGGATYQVPVEVPKRRSMTLAIRWIVTFSRTRGKKSMAENLAVELMDAANSTGPSIKKKEDLYKMAEANRAFAHYRW
jgi:small subunit ribosomal protein S7